MNSLSTSQIAGLALMVGMILVFIATLFSPGGVLIDSVQQSDFLALLNVWKESDSLTHVTGIITMLGIILMAFGLWSLLRLPRKPGLADMALRVGVGITIFAWGIYIIEMGMRHMAIHVITHGVYPGMDQATRDDVGLTLLAATVGVHFGFLALGSVASILVGLGVAVRFQEFNLFVLAGYGLALKGVAEVINLVLIQHLHDVDFGVLLSISNILLSLGGVWLIIIGYGIFHGKRELAPEGGD